MSNEQQYRELKEGEIVQEGDQVRVPSKGGWVPAHATIGDPVVSWDVGYFRRPIPEVTEPANLQNELLEALSALAVYASTVRIDRKDETGEFALQTVEWCEGLMEYVTAACKVIAKAEGKK